MKKPATLLKVRDVSFIAALAKITGVSTTGMTEIYPVLDSIDELVPGNTPCLLGVTQLLEARVSVVSDVFTPDKKNNLLLDFMCEADLDTPHLVMDAYLNGPESIFMVIRTHHRNSTVAKWLDFMKTTRLIVGEVEAEDEQPTYLIAAPLKSFYDSN